MGSPSWSLDGSETAESTKCLWIEAVGLIAWSGRAEEIVLSPDLLVSRDQDGGQSKSMIDIFDLTEK